MDVDDDDIIKIMELAILTLTSLFFFSRKREKNETHRINNFPIGLFLTDVLALCGGHLWLEMSWAGRQRGRRARREKEREKGFFYSFYTSISAKKWMDVHLKMRWSARTTRQQPRNSYSSCCFSSHRWTAQILTVILAAASFSSISAVLVCFAFCQRPMLFPSNINLHSLGAGHEEKKEEEEWKRENLD